MKFYQQNVVQLSTTVKNEEKVRIKKLTKQFFMQHDYFSIVWLRKLKKKIVKMVGAGKGIIPYEKITSITSLDSEPECKYFFEKSF